MAQGYFSFSMSSSFHCFQPVYVICKLFEKISYTPKIRVGIILNKSFSINSGFHCFKGARETQHHYTHRSGSFPQSKGLDKYINYTFFGCLQSWFWKCICIFDVLHTYQTTKLLNSKCVKLRLKYFWGGMGDNI